MSTIEAVERETYDAMWGFSQYAKRSPGEQYVDMFLEMAGLTNGYGLTLLDAGCGSGKGAVALKAKHFTVSMCDLTPNGIIPEAKDISFDEVCLWRPLSPQLGYRQGATYDYVYCCDVLEHVPTPMTMLVVANLLKICRRGLFLSIALHPDQYGMYLGHPLHRTVEGFVWWRDHLRELGTIKECRDLHANGLYLLEPR